jgi:uncharacterized protein (TIGR03067 family)
MPLTLMLATTVASLALDLAGKQGPVDRVADRLGALGWAVKRSLPYPLVFLAPRAVATREDEERLRGTWEVIDWEFAEGMRLPLYLRASPWATFAAGRTSLLGPEATDFQIDATCTPKRIDLRDGARNIRGVYRLEGDSLRICLNTLRDKERPPSFQPQTRSLDFDHFLEGEHEDCLLILKRKRP